MITRSDIYKMDEMQKIRLALDSKTRKEILHELAKDNNPVIRALVAKNPNIDIETQKLLLRDKDKMVLENLAYNPKCDWKILDRLAENFDGRIREIVAEDDYYPLESEIDESAEVIEYEENGEIK